MNVKLGPLSFDMPQPGEMVFDCMSSVGGALRHEREAGTAVVRHASARGDGV